MRVKKILNNSLVLVENENHEDLIFMGKGLSFRTKVGQEISPSQAEKIFVSNGDSLTVNMMQLAEHVDVAYFELVKKLLDYAGQLLSVAIPDYLYLSLTDHIAFAVDRFKQSIDLELVNLEQIQLRYPKEFQVGQYALKLIEETFDIHLFPNEAASIALHFINIQESKNPSVQSQKIQEITTAILNIIKYHFKLIYEYDDISYIRAVSHFQLLAKRLLDKDLLPNENNPFLYRHILESCPNEADCAQKIDTYFWETYQTHLTNQEEMYLVLHIHRLLNSKKTPQE